MAQRYPYLSPEFRPGAARVFAHRGWATGESGSFTDENTIDAFKRALDAGADYLESDIQVTDDGVAVLFHDDTLLRVAGDQRRVDQVTWQELRAIKLPFGQLIPSLEEALTALPDARFNLDFKTSAAIGPAVSVIKRLKAQSRILATSFSVARRKRASRMIGGSVAQSAGSSEIIALYVAHRLGLSGLFRWLAGPIQCLQIPVSISFLKFANPAFIGRAHECGLEVHFWTINDPNQMAELLALGADGLVTDRADIAREIVDTHS